MQVINDSRFSKGPYVPTSSEGEVILSAPCTEPKGTVWRNVWFMYYTPDNLKKLWDKTSKFPMLLGNYVTNFEEFLGQFINPNFGANGLTWIVDDFVGMYFIDALNPHMDASVHYSFFDQRQKGRIDLTLTMLRYVFNLYDLQRVSTTVPMYANKPTFRFIEQLGFKEEGRKRRLAPYRGQLFDVKLFGLLREELK